MAPVIRVTSTTNAQVDTEVSSDVKIAGGSVKTDTTVSMDINGNIGAGLKISKDAILEVRGNIVTVVQTVI